MAALILVRHGQASLGAENYDCLSALGERQGEWLGEYFAERDIKFDRVLVGSMQRQRQTAAAILRGLGHALPYEEHAGLDEYDFQALYRSLGRTHQELKADVCGSNADYYKGLKQALYLWSRDQISGPVPETWEQFQQRVANVRRDIQLCGGRRILAVSSGGTMAVMAQQVLQAQASTAIELNMQIRNTSFCEYFFNATSFRLASFNSLPHLDQPLRLSSITYG